MRFDNMTLLAPVVGPPHPAIDTYTIKTLTQHNPAAVAEQLIPCEHDMLCWLSTKNQMMLSVGVWFRPNYEHRGMVQRIYRVFASWYMQSGRDYSVHDWGKSYTGASVPLSINHCVKYTRPFSGICDVANMVLVSSEANCDISNAKPIKIW